MPQERKGRNGGTLRSQAPGDPSLNPSGRPEGSTSLKAIANKILDGKITVEEAEGQYRNMTRREAMLLRIIQDAVEDDDPNVRLRAAQIIMDRTEGKPVQSTEVSGKDGEPIQFEQTVIKIAYRPPADAKPTASKAPNPAKGERKKG